MANTKKTIETTNDKKDKLSIIEIIQDIDARLTHLEDMQMDNRELIVKLVKQGNTIVEFLKDFKIEEIDPEDLKLEMGMELPPLPENEERVKKTEGLKELIDDILDRHADLKEFEDELKKHKDKITPGQVGES
jgi:CRISPR/Cas system CSM-associated protein Csm2 small subunit